MLLHHDDSADWRTMYEEEEEKARATARRNRPFKFPKFHEYMRSKIQDHDDGTTPTGIYGFLIMHLKIYMFNI